MYIYINSNKDEFLIAHVINNNNNLAKLRAVYYL